MVRTIQQRVNLNSSCALLWGCVVYSCLSSLSLSSTSPAIEPSSLPPSRQTPSGNAYFLPLAPPHPPAGRWGVEQGRKCAAMQCHRLSMGAAIWCDRMCARASPNLFRHLSNMRTNKQQQHEQINLLTDVNPNYRKYV